jgi:hypothetical protein
MVRMAKRQEKIVVLVSRGRIWSGHCSIIRISSSRTSANSARPSCPASRCGSKKATRRCVPVWKPRHAHSTKRSQAGSSSPRSIPDMVFRRPYTAGSSP